MTIECLLCTEETSFIGIGECNHQPICYRCIFKMRVINKNNLCPICKTKLLRIIIIDKFAPYESFEGKLLADKTFADVFFFSEKAQAQFQKLTEFKCFVKIDGRPCENSKPFVSLGQLKKHLREKHNRYVCEICIEKKTCVLDQQHLYTYKALMKHMDKGDTDEFNNITFLHPHCKFCLQHFFDEEDFRRHLNRQHIICNVCGYNEKYRFYKDYNSLQVHFKISHYICSDPNCLALRFIAFKTAEELKVHRLQVHDKSGSKKIDARDLCGFQYEGQNNNDENMVIKDKEGINMENQFLTMKKCKNQALGEIDAQNDDLLDPRVFYEIKMDEDEHLQRAFTFSKPNEEKQGSKKKKYIQKSQADKQKLKLAKESQFFTIQDLEIISTLHSPRLDYEIFQEKLRKLLREQQLIEFNTLRNKMMKKQVGVDDFIEGFLKIMKNVSLKNGYLILPHFVRTIVNEDLKFELDREIGLQMKNLPFKYECLIQKSNKYGDFFGSFYKYLCNALEKRIKETRLSIKKPVKRCKERLFQIMGVVRRLKIPEMAKFNFAVNFGLDSKKLSLLHDIFKKDVDDIDSQLDKLENDQMLDLYIFVKYCWHAIMHTKQMQAEKNKIHQAILEDFLYERPHLQKEFGLKKEEMKNLEEQVLFEEIQQEIKKKKQLKQIQVRNQNRGIQRKTDFVLEDKCDFPELIPSKKETVKKQQDLRQLAIQSRHKPATYQQQLNQMFPALGEEQQKPRKKAEEPQKSEKVWWQKINEKKQPEEVIVQERIRTHKGKKQKWVSVQGFFK